MTGIGIVVVCAAVTWFLAGLWVGYKMRGFVDAKRNTTN